MVLLNFFQVKKMIDWYFFWRFGSLCSCFHTKNIIYIFQVELLETLLRKTTMKKMNQKRMMMMLRLPTNLPRMPIPHQLVVEAVAEVLLDVHVEQEAVVVLKFFCLFCIIIQFALKVCTCTTYNYTHNFFSLSYYFYIY